MIVDLPSTTTSAINGSLVDIRETGGAVALSRVLTLVIVTEDVEAEEAIEAANDASREHPCRVLVVAKGSRRGSARLDAQIRVGGDAGASEVIVLRLYGELALHGDSVVVPLLLPDAPVVAWWPGAPPPVPSEHPIGAMAQRRITDSAEAARPHKVLRQLAENYADGDTDLAWSRLTLWRGLLAAALDQPPYERVASAVVTGAPDSPSTELLGAWLALALRCPVTRSKIRPGGGIAGVRLQRRSGAIELLRPEGNVALLTHPGQPDRQIALPRRSTSECLAEELRRLDPDDIYQEVVTRGLALLDAEGRKVPGSAAPVATSPQEASRRVKETASRMEGRSEAMKRANPARKQAAATQAPASETPAPAPDGAS
ncbi:MAG: glucose-6-phosphate dehydrogenase assembly protein OpcA [Actinomycetes bacterium]